METEAADVARFFPEEFCETADAQNILLNCIEMIKLMLRLQWQYTYIYLVDYLNFIGEP